MKEKIYKLLILKIIKIKKIVFESECILYKLHIPGKPSSYKVYHSNKTGGSLRLMYV